jgi:hypothetical protein
MRADRLERTRDEIENDIIQALGVDSVTRKTSVHWPARCRL